MNRRKEFVAFEFRRIYFNRMKEDKGNKIKYGKSMKLHFNDPYQTILIQYNY